MYAASGYEAGIWKDGTTLAGAVRAPDFRWIGRRGRFCHGGDPNVRRGPTDDRVRVDSRDDPSAKRIGDERKDAFNHSSIQTIENRGMPPHGLRPWSKTDDNVDGRYDRTIHLQRHVSFRITSGCFKQDDAIDVGDNTHVIDSLMEFLFCPAHGVFTNAVFLLPIANDARVKILIWMKERTKNHGPINN